MTIFWHDWTLEEKIINISWTNHTIKSSTWVGSQENEKDETRSHSCIPSREILLLCSPYVSTPVASFSPCPFPTLAISPVFFQSPNFDLGEELWCCDFSFTKSLIPNFPFSSFCSSKNTRSCSSPVPEPPKKQMAAGKNVSFNAFERAEFHKNQAVTLEIIECPHAK